MHRERVGLHLQQRRPRCCLHARVLDQPRLLLEEQEPLARLVELSQPRPRRLQPETELEPPPQLHSLVLARAYETEGPRFDQTPLRQPFACRPDDKALVVREDSRLVEAAEPVFHLRSFLLAAA